MTIQSTTSVGATIMASHSAQKQPRTDAADMNDTPSEYVRISQAARDLLQADMDVPEEIAWAIRDRFFPGLAAPDPEPPVHDERFRVKGPLISFEEVAKSKGLTPYKMTDDQIAEMKQRDREDLARMIADYHYSKAHQYQPIGQVFVDGKIFATVYDSGAWGVERRIPGLSEAQLSPADRLAEIARLTKGEIRYLDFVPSSGGGPGTPEYLLPPVTARNCVEIFEQDILPEIEKQRAARENKAR